MLNCRTQALQQIHLHLIDDDDGSPIAWFYSMWYLFAHQRTVLVKVEFGLVRGGILERAIPPVELLRMGSTISRRSSNSSPPLPQGRHLSLRRILVDFHGRFISSELSIVL